MFSRGSSARQKLTLLRLRAPVLAGTGHTSRPSSRRPSTSPTVSPTRSRSLGLLNDAVPPASEPSTKFPSSTQPPSQPIVQPSATTDPRGYPPSRSLRPPVDPFWLSIIAPAPGQAVAAVVRPHAVAITAPGPMTGSAIAAEATRKAKEKLEREKREARGRLLPPSSAANATAAADGPVLARITADDQPTSSSDPSSQVRLQDDGRPI